MTDVAFAFTDMSMDKLVNEIQRLQARKDTTILRTILNDLSKMDINQYTQADMLKYIKNLIAQNKIPSYILDRGKYSYVKNNNVLYLKGTNIRLRSEPNTNARIITTLNTDTTNYLTYLGEWKNSQGERWVLVVNNLSGASQKLGWIFGKYTVLVSNSTIQKLINQIKDYLASDKSTGKATNMPTSKSQKQVSLKSNSEDEAISAHETWKLPQDFPLMCIFVIIVFSAFFEKIHANSENMLNFFICSIFVIVLAIVAYFLLKLFFLKVIIPILSAIVLLGGLAGGNGDGSEDDGKGDYGPCPYSGRSYCEGCPNLSLYDHKYVDFYTDIHKCNALGCYVDPKKSPYDNIT